MTTNGTLTETGSTLADELTCVSPGDRVALINRADVFRSQGWETTSLRSVGDGFATFQIADGSMVVALTSTEWIVRLP